MSKQPAAEELPFQDGVHTQGSSGAGHRKDQQADDIETVQAKYCATLGDAYGQIDVQIVEGPEQRRNPHQTPQHQGDSDGQLPKGNQIAEKDRVRDDHP